MTTTGCSTTTDTAEELYPESKGYLVYDSKTDTVIDHEGRHRTALFKIMGLKKIPVVLIGKSRLDRFRVGRTKRQEYDW